MSKRSAEFRVAVIPACLVLCGYALPAVSSECDTIAVPVGEVIWCDSFEDEDLPPSGRLADNYFNYTDPSNGQFLGRTNTESYDGNYSLRQEWRVGDGSQGWLYRTFGRSPVNSQSHSNVDFREIYWRVNQKYAPGVTAFPNKLTRATAFASSGWAQAMIGHLWKASNTNVLKIDPASGTDLAGNLLSTKSNDFPNLRWMGSVDSSEVIVPGTWQCYEAHIKFNTPGASDGVFELWMDDQLVASKYDINWVGSYNDYGINAITLETYWNGGATEPVVRYLDGFVIATGRIGCGMQTALRPMPPTSLAAN